MLESSVRVEILKCQVMRATWSEISSVNILGNLASHLVIQIDVSDKSEAASRQPVLIFLLLTFIVKVTDN